MKTQACYETHHHCHGDHCNHAPGLVHTVRCYAGGNMLGSLFEDEHGQPLTRIGSIRRANAENAKTAERGHGFEYVPHSFPKPAPLDHPGYAARVQALEAEGMTTSDAQAVADAELA